MRGAAGGKSGRGDEATSTCDFDATRALDALTASAEDESLTYDDRSAARRELRAAKKRLAQGLPPFPESDVRMKTSGTSVGEVQALATTAPVISPAATRSNGLAGASSVEKHHSVSSVG